MANEEQQHGAVSIGEVINGQIATKIDYLQQLQNAIADHNDCQVYQLLDNQRYAAEIEHREQQLISDRREPLLVGPVRLVSDRLTKRIRINGELTLKKGGN